MLSEFLLMCACILLIGVIHFVKSNPKRVKNYNSNTSPIKGVYYQSDINHGRYDSPYMKYKHLNNRSINSQNIPKIPSYQNNSELINSPLQYNQHNQYAEEKYNKTSYNNYNQINTNYERGNDDKYFNYYITSSDKKSMIRKEHPLITPPYTTNKLTNQIHNTIYNYNDNLRCNNQVNNLKNDSIFSSFNNGMNNFNNNNNYVNSQIHGNINYNTNTIQNNNVNILKECLAGNIINAEKLEMYLSNVKDHDLGISVVKNNKNITKDSPNCYYFSDKKEENSVNNPFIVNSDFRMTFASNNDEEELRYKSNITKSMNIKENYQSISDINTNKKRDLLKENEKLVPSMFDYMTSNVKKSNPCFKTLVEESNKRINSELKSNTKELNEKESHQVNTNNVISSYQDNKENINDNNIKIILDSISKKNTNESITNKDDNNTRHQRRSFTRNVENVLNSSSVITKNVNTCKKSISDMIKEVQVKEQSNLTNQMENKKNESGDILVLNENIARNLNFYDISISNEHQENNKIGVTPQKGQQLNMTEIKEILMASNLNLNKSLSNTMSQVKLNNDIEFKHTDLDISELKCNENSVLWTPPRDSNKKGAEFFDSFGKS